MGPIFITVILGIAVAAVSFFVVRSIITPTKVSQLRKLLKQGKTNAVIKGAKQVVAKDARNADAHYILGLAYDQEGKSELALMEFKTVNQIGQFDGMVPELPFRTKIAELYAKFNQPEEALKEYLILVKREENNPDHYLAIGRLFEERNRSAKAIAYYRKAADLSPRNGEAHARVGVLLFRAKHPLEAKAALEKAVRLQPENHEGWYYLGKILKDNKDCVAAVSAFEKAARGDEHKVKALIERGGCFISMGSMERAISELERAAKLADDGSQEVLYAHYFLAHALEKMRRIEQAIDHWEFIYSKKSTFKDVAEKLSQYQELRTDDRVKDYMTVGNEEYLEICKKVTSAMELQVRDARIVDSGCDIIAVEAQSKWRNARKMPKLLRFMRVTDTVDESSIRTVHEEMKKQNVTRGVVLTSSVFSRMAIEFAQTRPIELHNKEQLQELLKQIAL